MSFFSRTCWVVNDLLNPLRKRGAYIMFFNGGHVVCTHEPVLRAILELRSRLKSGGLQPKQLLFASIRAARYALAMTPAHLRALARRMGVVIEEELLS